MPNEFSVQGGIFKNKKIPIIESSKGHSNFTTSIMKKAVFSMIDSHVLAGSLELETSQFIDLFSGSGQMALEAVSRGFNKAQLFEIDIKRFGALKKNLSPYAEKMVFHHKDCFRYYNKLEGAEEDHLIYFLDPPYSFWENEKIMFLIDELRSLKNCFKIYIQSPEELKIRDVGRRFGNCYITEIN